jgi:osmotically-inducible protein OsmY
MKATKLLLTFSLGVIVGIVGHWYMSQPRSQEVIANARQEIKEKFTSQKVKEDLAQAGQNIKDEAEKAGTAVSDATANARITTAIKTKLIADSGLSAFKIDVDTTDGVVTLSGTVPSPEAISHAMKLAMEVEGVQQVISTLTVRPVTKANH